MIISENYDMSLESRVQAHFLELIAEPLKARPPALTNQRVNQLAHQAALKSLSEHCIAVGEPECIDNSEWYDILQDVKTRYLETEIRTALVHGHDLSTLYRATEGAFTEVARIEDRSGEPCPVLEGLWQAYREKDLDSKAAYSLYLQALYYLRKHGAERCAERLRAALDARPHVLEAAAMRVASDETEPV